VCLVLRFAIPCISLVNRVMYDHFLIESYEEATSVLKETRKTAQGVSDGMLKDEADEAGSSIWSGVKGAYGSFREALGIKERAKALIEKLRHSTRYVVNLIALFIVQSVLIPIVVLWALIRFAGYIFGSDVSAAFERILSGRIIASEPKKGYKPTGDIGKG
jgi:hypothetical protein